MLNTKVLILFISCPFLVQSDVLPTELPPILKQCMKSKVVEDKTLSDDEISTSCLLEFMWLKGKKCAKVSSGTVDWLSSLVHKSVITTFKNSLTGVREMDAPLREGMSVRGKLSRNTTSRTVKRGPPRRKEYRMLSDEERNDYHDAINAMKNDTSVEPNKYDAMVIYHTRATLAAHGGPAFLAWHRYFLVLYELALQQYKPNVMLPYWDSSLDFPLDDQTDSVLWTPEFLGNGRDAITSGPFSGWTYAGRPVQRSIRSFGRLIQRRRVQRLIRTRRSPYFFITTLEQLHNLVHVWVGGNMLSILRSPSDPVFYMHHAYIDCLWEEYRRIQKRRKHDPTKYPRPRRFQRPHHNGNRFMQLPPLENERLRNRDGYKNFWTEQYYDCAPRPWCSNRKPNCGSKWLQCDLFQKQCVTKDSSAVQPEITTDKLLQIARQVAPEPEDLTVNTRRISASRSPTLNPESPSEETIAAAKEVSALEFFSLLNNMSSPRLPSMMSSRKSVNRQRSKEEEMLLLHAASKTIPQTNIDDFVVPEFKTPCMGYPTQNTFSLDCKTGIHLYNFMAVKVIWLRYGNIIYDSHPVDSKGEINENVDIFSTGYRLPFSTRPRSQKISEEKQCNADKSGLIRVKVISHGMNYNGFYEDDVFLNNRQSVSSAISYIAVKKSNKENTTIFVSAVDECGMSCQPMILQTKGEYGHPVYTKFSGAATVTNGKPVYHSSTYRGAEALVWSSKILPFEDTNQIPIVFYCNHLHKRPWF